MRKKALFIAFLIYFAAFTACNAFAETSIYQWKDASGETHFSDQFHPGASSVQLSELQTYPAYTAPAEQPPSASGEKKKYHYTVRFIQPSDQASIRNNQGIIRVQLAIQPALLPNAAVQLMLDGKPREAPQQTLSWVLNNIDRGTHTLQAIVLNKQDKQHKALAQSTPITFYLHQALIKNSQK